MLPLQWKKLAWFSIFRVFLLLQVGDCTKARGHTIRTHILLQQSFSNIDVALSTFQIQQCQFISSNLYKYTKQSPTLNFLTQPTLICYQKFQHGLKLKITRINSHYENLHGLYKLLWPTVLGKFSVGYMISHTKTILISILYTNFPY